MQLEAEASAALLLPDGVGRTPQAKSDPGVESLVPGAGDGSRRVEG